MSIRKRTSTIITGFIVLSIFLIMIGISRAFSGNSSGNTFSSNDFFLDTNYDYVRGDKESENLIVRIKIVGPILNESAEGDFFDELFGSGLVGTYGYDIKETLYNAVEYDNIAAVMLEVDSPGGTITGSDAIADGVRYFKQETGKPVFGWGSGLVASGGYWAIAEADQIYADTGTLIGSIGVINGIFQTYDNVVEQGSALFGYVVTTNGIETTVISAGEGKDLGNPYRQLTEREIQILQESANNAYNDFVTLVSQNRAISDQFVREEIGAYIYGENQALDRNLIDGEANREEVYAILADSIGIDSYQVVQEDPFQSSLFDRGLSGALISIFGNKNQNTNVTQCPFMNQQLAYYGNYIELCKFIDPS